MLMQLKNKQHKIASITLSLFIGSWLLLLCQTCITAIDDINHELPVESSVSCHSSALVDMTDGEDVLNEDVLNNEHCPGACDCDAVMISISTDKNSELKEKIKYSLDLYAYVTPELTLSTRAPPAYRISVAPERAILLPLQYSSILLI